MKDDDEGIVHEHDTEDDIPLYDPFSHHFVSQKKQNEFLKALEDGQHETVYGTIH